MIKEFQDFLLKTNALALAVGVIIGAAVGKLVRSLVADVLMPLIGLAIPGGNWRELQFVLSTHADGTVASAVTYGQFVGAAIDFIIIAFVVFMGPAACSSWRRRRPRIRPRPVRSASKAFLPPPASAAPAAALPDATLPPTGDDE